MDFQLFGEDTEGSLALGEEELVLTILNDLYAAHANVCVIWHSGLRVGVSWWVVVHAGAGAGCFTRTKPFFFFFFFFFPRTVGAVGGHPEGNGAAGASD